MTDRPTPADGRMPAIYLGHGAPPLLEDPRLDGRARRLGGRPAASEGDPHRQRPLADRADGDQRDRARSRSSTTSTASREHYYRLRYDAPGAPELAAKVRGLMPATEPVLDRPTRGLDHGAWVPLKAMYPEADIPVLQLSMPDLDPQHLFDVGRRLAPLRDEGVLIVGSGFLTHGLPFVHEYFLGKPGAPAVVDRLRPVGDGGARPGRRRRRCSTSGEKAPGMPYAHPTVEHFAPLFVTLGAVARPDDRPDYAIEGFAYGLSKRSFEAR